MMFPLQQMIMLLFTMCGLTTSAPSAKADDKNLNPVVQQEPEFHLNSFYSQHPSQRNLFPFAWRSNSPPNTNQPSDNFHNFQQFPPFPSVPFPPLNIPSFLLPLYPTAPFPHPNAPSFHSQPSHHHFTGGTQPRTGKPKIEYETDNNNFHRPQELPSYPSVEFPRLNIPSFKFPLYPPIPFPHHNISLFPHPRVPALPTFAPLGNPVFPPHYNNFPTFPPLPSQNQQLKALLKQSEILQQFIKTDPLYLNVTKTIKHKPHLIQPQNLGHISQNMTKMNMEPPPQLRHLFKTFVPKNKTTDSQEVSLYDAFFGQQNSSEIVIVGVDPLCSEGRCWCPLLHYYDSDSGRCVHQHSEICKNSQFKCNDGRCIEGHMRCDGFFNCLDGTDENNCTQHTCLSSQFQCSDGICVDYQGSMCNSVLDCLDGSDEAGCNNSSNTCSGHQFQCGDGSCIYKDWQCDRFQDCFDASDELDCIVPNCSANQFQCEDGTCIGAWRKCDSTPDCPDASDEKNCSLCRVEQFSCVNSSSVKCVPMDSKCDYRNDCDDGSDEFDCLGIVNDTDYDGNANEYVEHFINKVNERIPRMIPEISAPLDDDLGIRDCSLTGVEMGLIRYSDSWFYLQNKTLTFNAQVATPRITFKCNWWPKNVKITSEHGILGFTTDQIVMSIKVKMELTACAKPEIEEIAIVSMGNMKPILKILGSDSVPESFLDRDHFKQQILQGVQENIRSFASDIEKHFKNVVKQLGDVTCIGDTEY